MGPETGVVAILATQTVEIEACRRQRREERSLADRWCRRRLVGLEGGRNGSNIFFTPWSWKCGWGTQRACARAEDGSAGCQAVFSRPFDQARIAI